jgi:hypothetical protein
MNEQQEQMINTQEVAPNKKNKTPLIICSVSIVVLIAAVATAFVISNKGGSADDDDNIVAIVDDEDDESEEDPEELNSFIDSIEYTEDMDFVQLQASLIKAGWTEPTEDGEGKDIADDYCGDGEKVSIDMEWTDEFFAAYTDHGARAILDTVYGYFKSVYPEYESVTVVEDSWYGSTFKIKADDGTIFEVNAATTPSISGNLLDVTKVSIYTEGEKQQLFVRDIDKNSNTDLDVAMTSDLSDNEATNTMSGLVGEEDGE